MTLKRNMADTNRHGSGRIEVGLKETLQARNTRLSRHLRSPNQPREQMRECRLLYRFFTSTMFCHDTPEAGDMQ